jgi:signal transduction histidine kinase/ActR/RegA family two-component response regulator
MIKDNGNGKSHSLTPANSQELPWQHFMPTSNLTAMGDDEHIAQFYETDQFLIDSLSSFVKNGLRAGDACVVIASKTHQSMLEKRLCRAGLRIAELKKLGQFVSLDVREALTRFMVGQMPDPVLFQDLFGGIVGQAAAAHKHVRVFGGMVAVLVEAGNLAAALSLEELWNELKRSCDFSLFCGYRLDAFKGEGLVDQIGRVCAVHSRAIPAESYTSLAGENERLLAIIRLQQKASALEAEIAQHKRTEENLHAVKNELEIQVKARERLLKREQAARAAAENASTLKDEFLATASHELRTPLNAIIGWSHMLRNRKLDKSTTARALETIERNAQSQAQLVEDILDVSRIITGKLHLNIGNVDIASVINAAIDSVQLAAEARDIELEVILNPSIRSVSGDAARLQQVIWNLLSNAVKFTPEGGRIEVRVERANAHVRIKITDTGAGICPDILPYIFDPFRQGDGTITRSHGGLGLGLAIVRHLVELHGGSVRAESPGEGSGASFSINLPIQKDSVEGRKYRRITAELPLVATIADSIPTLDGLKVLLVDDDADTLQILSTALSDRQARVQTATSVKETMALLEWYQPDILVSDLVMPDEDGYSLIGKLRAVEANKRRQIPAVALTACVRVDDRKRALSAGFNMFVPKPVEPSELVLAIANLAPSRGH